MKFLLLLSLCAVVFAQEHSFLEDGDSFDIEEADEDVMHRQLPMDLAMRAKNLEKMADKRLKDKEKMSKKREKDKAKMTKKKDKAKAKMAKKREMDKEGMNGTPPPTKMTMMPKMEKMTKMPKKNRVPNGLDPEIYGKDGCVSGKVRVDIKKADVTVGGDNTTLITAQAKFQKTKNPSVDGDKGGIFLLENTIAAGGACSSEVKLVFRGKKAGSILASGPCDSQELDAVGTSGVYRGATGFAVFKENKNVIHVNAKICQQV